MAKVEIPEWWLETTKGQDVAFWTKSGVTKEMYNAVLQGKGKLILAESPKPAIGFPAMVIKDPARILPGANLREQVKALRNIAGEKNVIDPWQICDVIGMQPPKDLPLIATPLEIVRKLAEAELNEPGFFSWRAGKLLPKARKPKLTPISMKWIWEKTTVLYQRGSLGKVLYSAGQSDCWYANEQFFTSRDAKGKVISGFLPRPGWAWATKAPVSGTKNQKHPRQTEILATFFKNLMEGVPEKLGPAFQEWAEKKSSLYTLTDSNWQEAAKQLSVIPINSLRRNPAEILWDTTLMRLIHGVKLLENERDWSPALSSYGCLVSLSYCDADGGDVCRWRLDDSNGTLGACLSADLEVLVL